MFNDAVGFRKIYIAPGYTDLRKGIDSLAAVIRFSFQLDPYDRNTVLQNMESACKEHIRRQFKYGNRSQGSPTNKTY